MSQQKSRKILKMHRYEFHRKLGTSHFDCFGSKC